MTDEPDKANIRFSLPMKIRHPCPSRAPSSSRAISCRSSSSSSSRRTRSRSAAALFVDQVGLAADDQHRALGLVLAPVGKARRDQLGGGGVERFAALADFGAQPRLGLGQGQAGQARVDEIADFGERDRAGPGGQRRRRDSRRCRRSRPAPPARGRARAARNSAACRRSSLFGASTTPAQADRPDSVADRRRQRLLDRLVAFDLRPRSRRARAGRGSALCMIPSTNSRSPLSVGIRPAEVCGWVSSPRSSSSCITPRIDAGDRLTLPASAFDPTGCPRSR